MNQKPGMLYSFRCVAHLYNYFIWQQKKILFAAAIISILSACNSRNSETPDHPLPSNDSSVFYPVQDYFIDQLANADTIENIQYTYAENSVVKDSAMIDSSRLNKLASPFLQDDINDIKIKKYYKETVFNDLSTESNTFTYTSVNNKLRLQSLNILLDTITNLVKRVDITRNYSLGDTAVTEKMWWKPTEGFSINRILELPDKTETIQQTNVMWSKN